MDGSITDSQFIYNEDERRDNYIKGSREKISTYFIEHFCCPNGTILDVSSDLKGEKQQIKCIYEYIYMTLGTVSLAALQLGHSVITIMESEDSCLDILQQLQDKFVVDDQPF